jgi:hypothetical protein
MHTHGDYLPHGHSLKHLLCESDVADGVEVAGATGTVNAGVDGRDVVATRPSASLRGAWVWAPAGCLAAAATQRIYAEDIPIEGKES